MRHVRDVLSFFTGGGYELWLRRIDPEAKKVSTMDHIHRGVVAAGQLSGVIKQLQGINNAVVAVKTSDESAAEKKENLAVLSEKYTELQKKKGGLMLNMAGGYVEPEKKAQMVKKSATELGKLTTGLNTALQKYNAGTSGLWGVFKAGPEKGDLTKIQNRSTVYPETAPGGLSGQAVPANRQQMAWMSSYLEGAWQKAEGPKGNEYLYIPVLRGRQAAKAEFTFENLFPGMEKPQRVKKPAQTTELEQKSAVASSSFDIPIEKGTKPKKVLTKKVLVKKVGKKKPE